MPMRNVTPKTALFALAVLAGAATWLPAQALYNNGQTIHIAAHTTVTVGGDVVNKGTLSNAGPADAAPSNATLTVTGSFRNEGFFFNYGTVALAGNWENRSSYHEGNGTFILNGTGPQTLLHNGQSFYNLVLDGGGEKQLADNATVTHQLGLQRGLLSPAAGSVLLLADGVGIEGGSGASYVNGRLFHEGSGYKFYPIGKNGSYAPLTLEDVLGASPVTGFEVFAPNPYAAVAPGLGRLSGARYWQRTQLSGSITEAKIGLSFDAADGLPALDSVVVAEAKEGTSPFRSLGQRTTSGSAAAGTVGSKEIMTGNLFAVGVGRPDVAGGAFFIPNAFAPASPHDEEKVLKMYGSRFAEGSFLFTVYDRWGNVVFQTRSPARMTATGWEGDNGHGLPLAGGVYTYLVRGNTTDGQPVRKAGTITLIR
jgi:hypothetical protein